MRRLFRPDDTRNRDPALPRNRVTQKELQSFRSINATALSSFLVPAKLRRRAISVTVSTQRREYQAGTSIPFVVTLRNPLPFPITIRTRSAIPWTWEIDGHEEASHVPLHEPPSETQTFRFGRGERKRFVKRWDQHFRVDERTWEPAEPGEHTIRAGINVPDPVAATLQNETTIEIVPE